MRKCFLTTTFFLSLLSLELFAQHVPRDRCIRDSLFLLIKPKSPVQKACLYLDVADIIMSRQPGKSFSYAVSAFRVAILEKNDTLKARSRIIFGNFYTTNRKFIQAHEHFLAAWKIYQHAHDTTGQLEALTKISSVNLLLDNYLKSLEYLKQGLTIAQKTKNKRDQGLFFFQLGQTYQSLVLKQAAIYFFTKALSAYRDAGDKNGVGEVQNSIGAFHIRKDNYDEALAFYKRLIQDSTSFNKNLMGVLYTRIGHIYDVKKDFRASLAYNFKALSIRRRTPEKPGLNSSMINIAGDYYNLEKPDSAKPYMDTGLNLAYRFDRKNLLENGYRHLYLYYDRHKNFEKALEFYARYSTICDELNYEKNRNNIGILEANQKLQRSQQSGKTIARQHDIQVLNSKIQDYQSSILRILLGLAGFSLVVFVFLLLYVRRDRQRMQNLHIQLSDEVREREALEVHTRENEIQYKFITDNSVDFITHLDAQNRRIYASPASLIVYGFEPDEILTKSPHDLTHPDYHAYSEAKFAEMIETRSARQFIYRARKKDGTDFWVESILNPLFDPISGGYKGMVGVTRDIQERKTKEIEIMEGTKQKENLLKEIHHRVKNNFAILVSLINMQMAQTKNPELLQSLTNLQLRIRTMALVHEMLYRSNDFEKISFPGYLRSLASVIAGTYNRRDIDLTVDADEVVMDIEASIPLGLIVNEILSNSYKHGFPDGRTGKIMLSFKVDPDNGNYCLGLRDDGIGMPEGVKLEQIKTMGLQVVQILCAQIEAKLEVVNNPGASFTITFQKSVK